jgi:DNA-binding NtrC family response regulator
MCNGNVLAADHFEWLAPKRQHKMIAVNGRSLEEAKAEFEKAMIVDALQSTRGNIKRTAALLKVDRSLLYQKMRRLGVSYR